MAIHYERVSEGTIPSVSSRDTMDCRVGHLRSLLAMTILCLLPLLHPKLSSRGRKPVAIHREPASEKTNPFAHLKTPWIAASLASLPPRNNKVIYLEGGGASSIWAPASGSIIRRAKRWTWSRSSVLREAYSNLPRRSV